jgi:hypothetical protein
LADRNREAWHLALAQAWYSAAFSRQKRLPPLKHLLNPPQTRTLTPEEKAQRQAEFDELTENAKRLGVLKPK